MINVGQTCQGSSPTLCILCTKRPFSLWSARGVNTHTGTSGPRVEDTGALRYSSGLQAIMVPIVLLSYYVVGLPLAGVLAFPANYGVCLPPPLLPNAFLRLCNLCNLQQSARTTCDVHVVSTSPTSRQMRCRHMWCSSTRCIQYSYDL
jgi:hypothetical protein